MGISGIGNNEYDNYNRTSSGAPLIRNMAASDFSLHINSEESENGNAMGVLGFPDGSSASVFKAEDYSKDNPIFTVNIWDAQGNMTKTRIDASKVDPSHASLQEMLVLSAERKLHGQESYENELKLVASKLISDNASSGYEVLTTISNWISGLNDYVEKQNQLGNTDGLVQFGHAAEDFKYISEDLSSKEGNALTNFARALSQYAEMIKDRIKNGGTSIQIGGQSYTEEEWKRLIHKIDKEIDNIKEDQAENVQEQNEAPLTDDQIKRLLEDQNSSTSDIPDQENRFLSSFLEKLKHSDAFEE